MLLAYRRSCADTLYVQKLQLPELLQTLVIPEVSATALLTPVGVPLREHVSKKSEVEELELAPDLQRICPLQ